MKSVTGKEFLSFNDNYLEKTNDPNGWITVSYNYVFENSNRGTFSVLASLKFKHHIHKTYDFDVDQDFGIPKYTSINDDVLFDAGEIEKHEQYIFKPFTIRREFNDELHPLTFDIIQHFILYHNLFFDHQQNAYFKIVNEEDEKIIEYVSNRHIRIKERYLKDYLTANEMILIRYHDHKNHYNKDILEKLKNLIEIKEVNWFIYRNTFF